MAQTIGIAKLPRLQTQLILIEASGAWVGSEKTGEGPIQLVTVPVFYIGKFSVSNREYGHFIEDGGYQRIELWTQEGFAWAQANQIKQPYFWENSRFNDPDQPVTGVSFFEACAYAKWAGGRLPTEIEWEKAARGTDGQTYPWGEKAPDLNLANYAPDFVPFKRSPTSVLDYPNSDSPFGCRQMVGNVFEWCRDYFHFDTPSRRGLKNFQLETRISNRRVLKGGAWTVGASRLRAAARWSYTPNLRDNILGFRIVFDLGNNNNA